MFKVKGLEKIKQNLLLKQLIAQGKTVEGIDKATQILYNRVRKNISLIWKNVEAKKSHPYSIALGQLLGGPWYLVHKESGKMRDSLTQEVVVDPTQVKGAVGFTVMAENLLKARKSTHSYLRCIIFGTEKMISRDFLNGSLLEVKKSLSKTMISSFREILG